MICGVVCRCGSDPSLLCLWRRPAATSLIRHLAWELPYAVGVVLKNWEPPCAASVALEKFLKINKNDYVKVELSIVNVKEILAMH